MRILWAMGALLGAGACGGIAEDEGGMVLDAQCELGTLRCDGPVLMLCTDGGTSWAALQACESAALCDPDPEKGCQEPGAD
jgi:hypothetical protein